jgi:hypothetical protein
MLLKQLVKAACLLGVLSASAVYAAPVTYDFTGIVLDAFGAPGDSTDPVVSGTYTFDTLLADPALSSGSAPNLQLATAGDPGYTAFLFTAVVYFDGTSISSSAFVPAGAATESSALQDNANAFNANYAFTMNSGVDGSAMIESLGGTQSSVGSNGLPNFTDAFWLGISEQGVSFGRFNLGVEYEITSLTAVPTGSPAQGLPVPEPLTIGLFASGLGLAGLRRRGPSFAA